MLSTFHNVAFTSLSLIAHTQFTQYYAVTTGSRSPEFDGPQPIAFEPRRGSCRHARTLCDLLWRSNPYRMSVVSTCNNRVDDGTHLTLPRTISGTHAPLLRPPTVIFHFLTTCATVRILFRLAFRGSPTSLPPPLKYIHPGPSSTCSSASPRAAWIWIL